MENHILQNNINTVKKRKILGFLAIAVLIGLMTSFLSFGEQIVFTTLIIGLLVLFIFLKGKAYILLTTLPGLILLIFLVPGSINLSVLTGFKEMKAAVGIDLNGIRLVLFCFIAGILLIINGRISKSFKIYCIFLLYCFFTLSYTSDVTEGLRFFAKLLVPLLIYSISKLVSSLSLEKINKAFICVILLHLPFVLLTLVRWFKPYTYSGTGDIVRASGISGGRVIFGTFMVFIFILFYYRNSILQKETGKKSYLPILISLLGVLLSGSRIAWIGLLIAMFMLGVFKKLKNVITIGVLVILLIGFFSPLLQQRIGIKMEEGELVISGYGAGTVRHRILILKWLFEEKISQRVFLGYGLGSAKNILSESLKAGIPVMDYPHNEYIRLFLEGGIIGVFLFCYSYFYMALYFIRKYKSILFISPILVYMVFCLADNTLNNYFENGAMLAYILVYLEKCFVRNRGITAEGSIIMPLGTDNTITVKG